MSLLAKDHRLPHLVLPARRAAGVPQSASWSLALAALLLLIAVSAETNKLIPLYAIGVFLGFTLSQIGLVRHWRKERPSRWRLRVAVNGAGAVMTASPWSSSSARKFTRGRVGRGSIAVPALMVLFARTEGYYAEVARELKLGRTPPRPKKHDSIVIVPSSTVNLLTEEALSAAFSLGDTVVAVAVAGDEEERDRIIHDWNDWKCGVADRGDHRQPPVADPQRAASTSSRSRRSDAIVTVLIPEVIPRKRRHEILHNQRGRLLAAVLKSRTNVIVATLPFKLHD